MGLAVRRKNRRIGGSSDCLNIPKPITAGKESTIAVNRLLANPRDEIEVPKILELPRSTQLILEFNRYCETKQACPSLYLDERGTPSCRATGGKCAFENCPKVRSA